MYIPSYWIKAVIQYPSTALWYRHWRSSLNGMRSPLQDELPWVTYRAIDWFSRHLTQNMVLFEWGSGGSTVFFSQHVKQVIAVEHDPVWYQQVADTLEKKGYKNISLKLVEPVSARNIDSWYMSAGKKYVDQSFEAYIKAIDEYPDHSFDVIVVDGRARPGCIREALSKVKPGGYLVLDNSERLDYQRGLDLLPQHKDIQFFGPGPYNISPWGTRIMQFQDGS